MQILRGRVISRYGLATPNLKTVESLILERTGLPSMAPGTLNVQLSHRYIVSADAAIGPTEYFTRELQRCRVRGHRMWIMRPDSHERSPLGPQDPARVLELISPIRLRNAWCLKDHSVLEIEVEGDADWWSKVESL